MGFDDLPIPNNGSAYSKISPLGLATVANYTKNPILDVGYQCKDSRPYFAFVNNSTTYYIRIHPDNLVVDDEVGVYSASSITKFGITYTKMTRLSGKATVTSISPSVTLSYNNVTYTYTPGSNTDVFLNKLNPWSFYKPYEYTGLVDTEYGQTRCDDIANNTVYWDNIIKGNSITYGFNYNRTVNNTEIYCNTWSTALNNASATNSYWNYTRPSTIFRLTDFIGYNKNAKCPGRSDDWSVNKTIKKVSSSSQTFVYTYDNVDTNCEIDIFSIDPSLRNNTWYVGAIISEIYMNSSGVITGRNNPVFYSAGTLNTVFPTNPVVDISEAILNNVTLPSGEGNYEVCWVLASGNNSNVNNNQPYVILPYGYSLLNYRLLNQDVTITPYRANFSTTYPGQTLNEQFMDFTWSLLFPAREDPGNGVIDTQSSQYTSLRFFFTAKNTSDSQGTVTLSITNSSIDSSSQISKTITIPSNSEYNFSVNVPFNQSQKLGNDDPLDDSKRGIGFNISFSYNNNIIYIDWINDRLTKTDPGYNYLYTSMTNNEHWLVDPNSSYIWTNGYLNEYTPVLDDSSVITV